jgi:hypothetical protein
VFARDVPDKCPKPRSLSRCPGIIPSKRRDIYLMTVPHLSA